MADYYCDDGAYGTGTGFLGNAPAWGVPQEGDGLAAAPAASVSIGSILLNGQPNSGNIMQVCGVTLTAGATTNTTTFAIGANVDATANNIATCINQATGTVSAAITATSPQLKTLVYARGPSTGAPAGTVQIMMKVGSANLNAHAANQIITNFAVAPTITQFAGGVSGCYGYFISDAAISNYTLGQYGIFTGAVAMMLAAPTADDVMYIRTGSNRTRTITPSATLSISRGYPIKFVFDTNTKWTSDDANGVYTLNLVTSSQNVTLRMAVSGLGTPGRYQCLRRGNFKITSNGGFSGTACSLLVADSSTSCHMDGVALEDASTLSSIQGLKPFTFTASPSGQSAVTFVNCDFTRTLSATTIPTLLTIVGTNSSMQMKFDGCKFTYNISGVADPGPLFNFAAAAVIGPHVVHFTNCDFVANGYVGGLTMFATGAVAWLNSTANIYDIRFENCTGLRYPTGFAGITTTTPAIDQDIHVIYCNLGADGYRVENCRGMVDWQPTDNPPTLSATLPDGVTDWSLRAFWLGNLAQTSPYLLPPFRIYNRLETGARTIGVEFLSPPELTYTESMLRMTVAYTDSTGKPRVESTTTVAASSATWANPDTRVAKKMTITTTQQVLTNTEVTVKVELIGKPSTAANAYLYFDPAPVIS